MSQIRVGILFGGRSVEHEVSRRSAFTIAESLQYTYDIFPIGISKTGQWYGPIPLSEIASFTPEKYRDHNITVLPNPVSRGMVYQLPVLKPLTEINVFFPALHGGFGEDGTMQGLLELLQIPYVGGGVMASSVGMDKLMMKKVFREAGLPQVPYLGFTRLEIEQAKTNVVGKIEDRLGYPCFVKPYNLGSSVGISRSTNQAELTAALEKAIKYSRKVIVEQGVEGLEIEVAVLGNDKPQASWPGEIVPCNDFYDYQAKYIDEGSLIHIPARLENEALQQISALAVKAHQAIDCAGLSRVDFFVARDTNKIFVNEINTLPGFTSISMYPKLWEQAGLSTPQLTAKLVDLALERYQDKQRDLVDFAE